MRPEEGVQHVEGWASHCRCGWRGPVRDAPLKAEEDGAGHECQPNNEQRYREALRYIAGEDVAGLEAHMSPREVAQAALKEETP